MIWYGMIIVVCMIGEGGESVGWARYGTACGFFGGGGGGCFAFWVADD